MTYKDSIMELYLRHGERGFAIDTSKYAREHKEGYVSWVNPYAYECPLVKLTPKALKLIREET